MENIPTSYPPSVDQQVRRLIEGFTVAVQQKRVAEANSLWVEVERLAPRHSLVLFEKIKMQVYSGDIEKAIGGLKEILDFEPKLVAAWQLLSHTQQTLKQYEPALDAINQALIADPSHPLLLLQKAEILELLGRPKAAAKIYGNALQTIPVNQRLPEYLEKQVNVAKQKVNAGQAEIAAYIEKVMTKVTDAVTIQDRKRFERGLDRFVGRRPIFSPNPTLFLFPFLSDREFYDRNEFHWIESLEAMTGDIRSECIHLLDTPESGLEPYVAYPEGLPLNQWAELNHSRRWSAAFLWKEGSEIHENTSRCPRTVQALRAIADRVDIPNRGPTAFFSILDSKTVIPPHTGVTNTRLTVHLPLVVPPEGCWFRVGGETRHWKEGEAWVFDDSIEHEAHNPTDFPRSILIFDIWNPELTKAERLLVRELIIAVNQYYDEEGTGVQWAL